MNKLRDFIKNVGKKEPEKPATKEDIEQLKLEVEKAKLESDLAKFKASKPKSKLAKLIKDFLNETPERRKARLDNTRRGFSK